jgi:hypothetical protein
MVSITATVLAKTPTSTPTKTYDFTKLKGVPEKSKSKERDNTPIFWGGVVVGTRQDILDGKIDMSDRSWKP